MTLQFYFLLWIFFFEFSYLVTHKAVIWFRLNYKQYHYTKACLDSRHLSRISPLLYLPYSPYLDHQLDNCDNCVRWRTGKCLSQLFLLWKMFRRNCVPKAKSTSPVHERGCFPKNPCRHPLCAPPTKTHHCHWWTQKCPRREWILEASDPWIKKEVPGNWAPGHRSEFSSLRCTFRAQPPDFRDALQTPARDSSPELSVLSFWFALSRTC